MMRDLLQSWRGLRQRPGFFVAALATLAIGIGANITIFTLVNGLSLRPMPFGDRTERLLTIHPTHRFQVDGPDWGSAEISFRDLIDFRTASTVEGIAAYLRRSFVLSGGETSGAERIAGGSVTPDLFPMLGIEPMLGRQFRNDDAAPVGQEPVVLLSHGLWQRRYGADPSIVGTTIVVNDRARTVIGVLPPGMQFPINDQMYMPLLGDVASRANRIVNAVTLMKPGVTIEQVRAEIGGIATRLDQQYPDTNRGFGVQIVPIRQSYVGPETNRASAMLQGAVGFVLLIMCANLANLMLVRGAARQRELAVRSAIGAGRLRLVWAALSESLLLAVPGTALGLLLSQWGIDWLLASMPATVPYWFQFGMDARVAAFTIAVALFTILSIGLLPALRFARPNLVTDLKEAARHASLGRGGQRLQSVLVVAQVALCFALLAGANLMVRSYVAMQTASLGFDERPLLTGGALLSGEAYDSIAARSAFYQQVVTTLESLPGISSAALTTATPGDDGGAGRRLVVDDRVADSDELNVQSISISPGLFRTVGRDMVAGRTFTDDETSNPASDVALVNETLAKQLWPDGSAIDRRIGFRDDPGTRWRRVVGVAPDLHYEEIGQETEQSRFSVYIPYAAEGNRQMSLMIRTHGSPDAMIPAIRDALARLSPTFPVSGLISMTQNRLRTSADQAFLRNLLAAFATGALLLACLGIYALISYSVGRRSREIGVRLALGASPSDVVRMLVTQSARVGGAGLLVGLGLAVLVANVLAGALYGVSVEASLFASVAAALAAALLVATWLPARRAAHVEPTIALRDE